MKIRKIQKKVIKHILKIDRFERRLNRFCDNADCNSCLLNECAYCRTYQMFMIGYELGKKGVKL